MLTAENTSEAVLGHLKQNGYVPPGRLGPGAALPMSGRSMIGTATLVCDK
jgi:hypothetical protein